MPPPLRRKGPDPPQPAGNASSSSQFQFVPSPSQQLVSSTDVVVTAPRGAPMTVAPLNSLNTAQRPSPAPQHVRNIADALDVFLGAALPAPVQRNSIYNSIVDTEDIICGPPTTVLPSSSVLCAPNGSGADADVCTRGLSTAPLPLARRASGDRKRQLSQQGNKGGAQQQFSSSRVGGGGLQVSGSTRSQPLEGSRRSTPFAGSAASLASQTAANPIDKVRNELYAWNARLKEEERARQLQRGAMDGV